MLAIAETVQTRFGLLFLKAEEPARHFGVYTSFLVDHYVYYANTKGRMRIRVST